MNSVGTNLVALVGRFLISLIFIGSGLSKIFTFSATAAYIASKGLPVPEVLATVAAGLELLGGIVIVVGYRVKSAAFALAIFTLVTAVLFHNFWAAPIDQLAIQQIMFLKNMSIAGGLILVATSGLGSWTLEQNS